MNSFFIEFGYLDNLICMAAVAELNGCFFLSYIKPLPRHFSPLSGWNPNLTSVLLLVARLSSDTICLDTQLYRYITRTCEFRTGVISSPQYSNLLALEADLTISYGTSYASRCTTYSAFLFIPISK